MPLKKEPCRNFQRGSCRYGDKCKFLHVTQQQPRPTSFGFGSQTGTPFQQTNVPQQMSNPFGFGVQSGQSGAPSNAFKPFENKWIRSEQPANQSQTASHKCTEPESCKRQIAEDFQHERPLWKLTCYGHYKYLPCDITGDVSYEELRAVAYDEAKRGINLQSIVERERTQLNSKLVEFENLLRNPYTKKTHDAQANQSPFPAAGFGAFSQTSQSSAPSTVSSAFGQLASSPNLAFGVRTTMPASTSFGQFQGSPGPIGTNTVASASIGSQFPAQTSGSPFGFGVSGAGTQGSSHGGMLNQGFGNGGMGNQGFGNIGMSGQGSQLPSASSMPPQIQTSVLNQSPMPNGLSGTNGFSQESVNIEPVNNCTQNISAGVASVWMKEEWKLGEIPEQPPPPAYVR